MNLIISEETYKKFSKEYRNISKNELQMILERSKPFSEYDYWNHFDIVDSLAYEKTKEKDLFYATERKVFSFFVSYHDMTIYGLPGVIELEPDSEGIIYKIYE